MNPRNCWHFILVVFAVQPCLADDPQTAVSASVVAEVNGHQIPRRELERQLQRLLRNHQGTLTPEERHQAELDLLRSLIDRRLLLDAAPAKKIKVDDAEVARMRQQFFAPSSDKRDAMEILRREGLSEEEFLSGLRDDLTVKRYVSELRDQAPKATDQELQQYFQRHRDGSFREPLEVRVRQLYLAKASNLTEAAPRPPLEDREAEVLRQLRPDGANFSELVRRLSDGPKKDGGDLGFVTQNQLPAEIGTAVFAAKPNTITAPLRTDRGTYLFQILEKRGDTVPTFDSVREQVRARFERDRNQRLLAEHLKLLRANANVVEYMY